MDPVSQGVLGAVTAGALSKDRDTLRLAALAGWAGGMLADADIFIRSDTDSLLMIEYHRHFSHSLLFIPVGGLICAAILWCLFRGRRPFGRLALFATAGFATSGLLDACTSYGTQLFWPFSDTRVSWNIISIIDPIFTGGLLVILGLALIKKRVRWMQAAVAFALCYLGFGGVQNMRASRVQASLVEQRGHDQAIAMATVKPSIGNLVLWRSVYRHGDAFHVDAIRVGWWGSARIFEGESVPVLELEDLQASLPPESVMADDLARFAHFSDDYLAHHPDDPEVIGDLRYSLLPNSVMPLWGIYYDLETPDQHARFETFRVAGPEDRKQLFRMIFSQP